MKRLLCSLLAALLLITLFAACGAQTEQPDNTDDGRISVVTTIFPPYDFIRQIAGDAVSVTMLLPPGSESHDFDPTLSDAALVERADLFIYIGGETDRNWVPDLLASVSETKTVALTDCVTLNEEEHIEGMQEEDHDHDHTHDEAEAAYDEHVWTSPKNAIQIVEVLCDALCELDPDHADLYRSNTEAYLDELRTLDADLTAMVEGGVRNTILFEGRFPFRYLCEDYGIDYYAPLSGCSSDTEVSLSTISFLLDKLKSEALPVVFHIEFSAETIADVLCDGTGANNLLLHSCHNVSQADFDGGVTYLSLMRQNLANLKEALY